MQRVEAIIRPEKVEQVKNALADAGFVGLNVVGVTGRGAQRGVVHTGRAGTNQTVDMLPKARMEIVVRDKDAERVVEIIVAQARTGAIGDGKIFLSPVREVVRIRTGERGETAL